MLSEGRHYEFISTSQYQRHTSQQLRRAVRSHAATVSHQDPAPRRRRGANSRLRKGEAVLEFGTNASKATEPAVSRSQAYQSDSANRNKLNLPPSHVSQSSPASPSTLRIFYPNPLTGHTFSPISSLSTYHRPYVPGVMDHYVRNLVIPMPELDNSATVPLFRAIWLPWVLHDPVIFQVVVLFAATHYATFADPSQYGHLHLELLILKQNALSSLIRAIQSEECSAASQSDPATRVHGNETDATSRDSLIAAAVKLASYEAIFGTVEAFHLHMSTVARMVTEREGGFDALGMNGFLGRLLQFVDTNSAFLLGTRPYLPEVRKVRGIMPQHRPFEAKRVDELDLSSASASSETATTAAALEGRFEDDKPTTTVGGADIVNLERFIGVMTM